MINNPEEILNILNSFDKITKKQLDTAIENADKEYTASEIENLTKQAYYNGFSDGEKRIKDILEEYLKEAEERYAVYKREVDNNENLKSQMWKHLGEVDILKRILNKPRKLVTLD